MFCDLCASGVRIAPPPSLAKSQSGPGRQPSTDAGRKIPVTAGSQELGHLGESRDAPPPVEEPALHGGHGIGGYRLPGVRASKYPNRSSPK